MTVAFRQSMCWGLSLKCNFLSLHFGASQALKRLQLVLKMYAKWKPVVLELCIEEYLKSSLCEECYGHITI